MTKSFNFAAGYYAIAVIFSGILGAISVADTGNVGRLALSSALILVLIPSSSLWLTREVSEMVLLSGRMKLFLGGILTLVGIGFAFIVGGTFGGTL